MIEARPLKLRIEPEKTRMLEKLQTWKGGKVRRVHVIIEESITLPKDGVEFDVGPILKPPKPLLAAAHRLHINTGHPTNADLERVCRLAGGSPEACALIKGVRCST